jgi:hypothetical protein
MLLQQLPMQHPRIPRQPLGLRNFLFHSPLDVVRTQAGQVQQGPQDQPERVAELDPQEELDQLA